MIQKPVLPILIFCEITPFIAFPFHPTKLSTMCLKRWGQKNEVFHPQLLLKVYLQTEGKGKEQPKLTQIRSKGMSPSCSQSLTDELECLTDTFIGKFRGVNKSWLRLNFSIQRITSALVDMLNLPAVTL